MKCCVVLALGLVSLTAGCTGFGESGLRAELTRVKSINGFEILGQASHRADISARGRRVRIEPANGLCIAEDSVAVMKDGAFAMIAECGAEELVGAADGTSELAFPGVLTISVSGQSGFDGERSDAEIARLKAFLETPTGKASLGRDGRADGVKILDMREIGDALYVHLEDAGEDHLSVFAPRFWRAFVRVNERLVLATANGFSKGVAADENLLNLLALQVTKMRQANLAPVHSEEIRLASLADADLKVASGAIAPGTAEEQEAGLYAPETSPQPYRRLDRGETGVQVATVLVNPGEGLSDLANAAGETPGDAPDGETLAIGGPSTEPVLPPPGEPGRHAPRTSPAAPPRPS